MADRGQGGEDVPSPAFMQGYTPMPNCFLHGALPLAELAVYFAVRSIIGETPGGLCFAADEYIAKRAGLMVRATRKHLASLMARKAFVKSPYRASRTGRAYTLPRDHPIASMGPVREMHSPCRADLHGHAGPPLHGGAYNTEPSQTEPAYSEPGIPRRHTYSDRLEVDDSEIADPETTEAGPRGQDRPSERGCEGPDEAEVERLWVMLRIVEADPSDAAKVAEAAALQARCLGDSKSLSYHRRIVGEMASGVRTYDEILDGLDETFRAVREGRIRTSPARLFVAIMKQHDTARDIRSGRPDRPPDLHHDARPEDIAGQFQWFAGCRGEVKPSYVEASARAIGRELKIDGRASFTPAGGVRPTRYAKLIRRTLQDLARGSRTWESFGAACRDALAGARMEGGDFDRRALGDTLLHSLFDVKHGPRAAQIDAPGRREFVPAEEAV